jgi:quinol monooxygenase YgiN
MYFMLELYADKAALDAHGATPHMAALVAKLTPVLGGAPVLLQGPAIS